MADAVGVILISVNYACILCLVKDGFVRSCSMYWQRGKKLPDASHSLFIARRIMSPQADWHSQLPRSYGFLWCWRGHPPLHLKRLCKSRPFASTRIKKKGLGGSKGVQWAKLCLYGELQLAQLSLIKIGLRMRIMTFLPQSLKM